MNADSMPRSELTDFVLDRFLDTSPLPSSESESGSITRLFPRVRAGDQEAESELFQRTCQELIDRADQILRRFPSVQDSGEELLSQLYHRLAKSLASVDLANRDHFFAVACRHIRFHLLDMVRTRRDPLYGFASSGLSAVADIARTPPSILQEREEISRLLRALDHLDERQRSVIERHVFLGRTFMEIGDEDDCAASTAKDRYDRAVGQLRVSLQLPDPIERCGPVPDAPSSQSQSRMRRPD